MNNLLMKFPNQEFYNNGLKSDASVDDININDILDSTQKEEALLFIDTSNVDIEGETHLKDSKSIVNHIEAEISSNIVNDYLNIGVEEEDI